MEKHEIPDQAVWTSNATAHGTPMTRPEYSTSDPEHSSVFQESTAPGIDITPSSKSGTNVSCF